MSEVVRPSGLIEIVKEEPPKETGMRRPLGKVCEAIEDAFFDAFKRLHPEATWEEITIGCMTHGPSPRKKIVWNAGCSSKTLPCIGCHPEAWAKFWEDECNAWAGT